MMDRACFRERLRHMQEIRPGPRREPEPLFNQKQREKLIRSLPSAFKLNLSQYVSTAQKRSQNRYCRQISLCHSLISFCYTRGAC